MPAGDDTRILDLSERPLLTAVPDHDFWLVDHEFPVRMHYDETGRPVRRRYRRGGQTSADQPEQGLPGGERQGFAHHG